MPRRSRVSTSKARPAPSLSRRIPRQERSRETVERILEVSQRILEADGPSEFNMNVVARRLGVSIGTVYEYFPDKASIVEALIERAVSVETGAVVAGLTQGFGTIQETFRVAIATLFDVYKRHHSLVIALRTLKPEIWDIGGRPSERWILDAMEQNFTILFETHPKRDPKMAAFIVFHSVEALVSRLLDHRDVTWSDERCVDEITQVVLRYLGIPESG